MKKVVIFILFILFFIPFTTAQEVRNVDGRDDRWIYNSEFLILDVKMTTTAEALSTGSSPSIQSASANINFFPRENDHQIILAKEYTPEPKEEGDSLIFEWDHPRESILETSIKSKVKITNTPMRITQKVPFPIQGNFHEDVLQYTHPAKIIDTNRDIVNLASELAAGEDDMVVVVDKLAAWTTQNIEYDLSTVTAEATQQATWVLKNRVGVCDELTSLFISMLRSLDIPARFVSGISYTNSDLFDEKWGAHGWAEVYFPNYGWIPYDVTYGEYGFVDPTHITSKISLDAEKITTKYTWRGKNVNLDIKGFSTEVTIADSGKELSPYIDLDTELFKGSVNFGSYNFVKATIKNKGAFYQPLDVYLSKTNKLTVLDDHKQHVLLKPYEEKVLFWRIMVDQNLEKEYIYTFPISVYTLGEVSQKKEFKAIKGGISVSEKRMEETIARLQGDHTKTFDTTIDVQCNSDKIEFYDEETPKIQCRLTNQGNTFFKNLNVCIKDQCETIDLALQEQKNMEFTVVQKEVGLNELVLSITNDQLEEQHVIEFAVTDKPSLAIININHQATVKYNEIFSVSFMVDKLSDSKPVDVQAEFRVGGVSKTLNVEEMEASQKFIVNVKGKDLNPGINPVKIQVSFKDRLGNEHTLSKEEGYVVLEKVNGWQRVVIAIRNLGSSIMNLLG